MPKVPEPSHFTMDSALPDATKAWRKGMFFLFTRKYFGYLCASGALSDAKSTICPNYKFGR